MAEATFPLPADVTEDERRALREGIAGHATVLGEDATSFRFEGEPVGQTGPVHRFQYLRLYRIAAGYLAIGHDLRDGVVIRFASSAEALPTQFEPETVREFVEDELRFRRIIGPTGART